MTSQELLLVCGAVAAFLIIAFFVGRRPVNPPSRLKVRAGEDAQKSGIVPSRKTGRYQKIYETISNEAQEQAAPGKQRNLNLMFMYNGHNFDAYEVLGLPAGAQLEAVHAAYQLAIKTAAAESQGFLQSAYQAILQDRKS